MWRYPEVLFFGELSLAHKFKKIYNWFIPYSHFVLSFILNLIFFLSFLNLPAFVQSNSSRDTLIEGVVMGVNENGDVQRINKVNPIIASNIQLEKDMSELIYEPLIRYSLNPNTGTAEISPVLVEEIIKFREGADYQFRLKKNVLWHDGKEFNADDVVATFDLISSLNVSNPSIQAIKQLQWEKIDDYNLRICTKNENNNFCNAGSDSPIFSNFLELIGVKILPKHKISDINSQTINTNQPSLFRTPIGTGKYKFAGASSNSTKLEYFDLHHDKTSSPTIKKIEFKFFKTLDDAIIALKNSEINSLPTISVEYLNDIKKYKYIETNLSEMIDQQYWGLYFNLRKDPNGRAVSKEFLQDVEIRKAISFAINREAIIQNSLLGAGKIALGPISFRSDFFNFASLWLGENQERVQEILSQENFKYDGNLTFEENKELANNILRKNGINVDIEGVWLEYNPNFASKILDETDWKLLPGNEYRVRNGEIMEFNLYFVDSFDRKNIAQAIKNDLKRVGIKVNIDRREHPGQENDEDAPAGWTLEELNNQVLAPRLFDVILYGMETFVDPDRYELFHSSQQTHPGLNISGYTGTVESVQVLSLQDRQNSDDALARVPKVDRILDETRSFDPVLAKNRRKEEYNEFQNLLIRDFPVVFLYHPKFIYFTNKVQNIDLSRATSLEERFLNIHKWEFSK
ncbi:MAG: peptide ABC transporter substrate-binding protein [Candidatus Dojkabacteria bacterium]|nr:MAG: peptide ABC transporter substrate-binding protein [Candidatus Dojkabacteria bacterium]